MRLMLEATREVDVPSDLTDLDRILIDGVSSGAFPGAVAIVASSTEVLASAAAGTHNLDTGEPLTTDRRSSGSRP